MRDAQKTRALLIADLVKCRQDRTEMSKLIRKAADAFTHLPFDHATRREVLKELQTTALRLALEWEVTS